MFHGENTPGAGARACAPTIWSSKMTSRGLVMLMPEKLLEFAVRNKAVRDSGLLARGYQRFVKCDFRSEAGEAREL